MIKQTIFFAALTIICIIPVGAQVKKKESVLKREVTLYNPYKPSLSESKKKSFLPEMNDTVKVRPSFRYDIRTEPFLPVYTINPIKAATLLPDPLPKLYKSYLNVGFGNYTTPLAELSITNERSKKGTLGFYAHHFSSNGNIGLQNGKKAFAGYMDNDASLFGRKFLKNSLFESSVNFLQKTRYAYGYNPAITDYSPSRKDVRMNYDNIGAKASLSSLTLDSTIFSYDFDVYYNFFFNEKNLSQHSAGFSGIMAKSFKRFYIGSGIRYDYYKLSDSILTSPKYVASISPFLKRSSGQWNVKLGFQMLIDKNMDPSAEFHIYPDFNFGFNIVPEYIGFFAALSGKLERNEPLKIIGENSFLIANGTLFKLPDTDHKLIASAGLKGNSGINGNYLVSASYSMIDNMLFYSNIFSTDVTFKQGRGNYFSAITDNSELLNIHAEMNGVLSDKLSYNFMSNLYRYTLAKNNSAWDKPSWDGKLGLKYNLRDKIISGIELTGQGKRKEIVSGDLATLILYRAVTPPTIINMPSHFNLNISAEYRYSKILSFWTKFNNISSIRYYEWAFYPSQRFLFMLGFTYSL